MPSVLENYSSLTPTSPRKHILAVLQSAMNDARQALALLKTLGRTKAVSDLIATQKNLSILRVLFLHYRQSDPEASNEALRCVANALLLIERGRTLWVDEDVGGSEVVIDMLRRSSSPDQIFLACRILFLCTASPSLSSSYITTLVGGTTSTKTPTIVELIGSNLDSLTAACQSGASMSKEAMTDLLKFTFNLLNHYPKLVPCNPQDPLAQPKETEPKVIGDFWNTRLDGLLPPLLRAFNTLPLPSPSPLSAPLSHVIHCLITIPCSLELRPVWFKGGASETSESPALGSPGSAFSVTGHEDRNESSKTGPIERALSALSIHRRSSSSRPSSPPSPSLITSVDTLSRAYTLLDLSMEHYLPGNIDVDEPSIRDKCRQEGIYTLDDAISPVTVLLSRLCLSYEDAKVRVREWLLPATLDRTSPLELRSDLLGRCIRFLGSVYHPRLKDAVGEMLFAICDSDAGVLSAYLGYGNVAGFLYHKGVMAAPPRPSSTAAPSSTPDGTPIDPITGVAVVNDEGPDMTEEEKEREAERLFVLFDRLERTGAIRPGQNPLRQAMQRMSGQ
ncbi:hypothetical protein JAAARDRAFT_685310 [Jaapia argillacea MUCL 33604]|uniref:Uncharacterized protein n=1 Tax=Jaapia argillacea MUCL 33604 TaxID=933084 RepID=A0A067QQZ9_9AGAM|nr:hypothetical protein JAAARDRAFT_685310 [Jaapia argillacea MUCL 33604]